MRAAWVVPVYGAPGDPLGADGLARIAGRLARHWELEILTTCAADPATWSNFHPPGSVRIDGVRVRRFRVDYPRSPALVARLEAALSSAGGGMEIEARWGGMEIEARWIEEAGPCSSSLLRHLEADTGRDLVFFFGYDAATTVHGMPRTPGRTVLVPLARDEPRLRLATLRTPFLHAHGLVFRTPSERDLVLETFAPSAPHAVVARGGSEGGGVLRVEEQEAERAFLEIASRLTHR